MVTPNSAQRAYRAACPNCGAPVEFRSSATPFAICGFCRSAVVRAGAELRKIGESAEVFDDHSPIRLGASGKHQGAAFTIVGRLQYRYADGTWNEWHALFESGADGFRSGWLSEDNGRYVIAFDAPLETPLPPAEQLRPGAPLTINGQSWSVASVTATRLIAAEGELPKRPQLGPAAGPPQGGTSPSGAGAERLGGMGPGFVVADVRSARGEVGTIDYTDPARPAWSIGTSVVLSELAMTGLAETAEKTLAGRTLACPNCGAALEVRLATTQSISCHQCKSVVDVSQGVGGDLGHYQQAVGQEPQIPLGTVGRIAFGGKEALPWQVVGYVERCEVPQDAEDEQTFWREYLLYHGTRGFAFLVDAEDGWSWTAPLTGAPEDHGERVRHAGDLYKKLYDYTGRITYVVGEFYWQLARDQQTANSDYQGMGQASEKRLNREETQGAGVHEVVWSAGATLSADVVAAAFGLAGEQGAALQRDSLPNAFSKTSLIGKIFFWILVVVVVLIMFRCDGGGTADCNDTRNTFGEASQEYQNCLSQQRSGSGFRTGGGSFGGYSSGGGHK